MLWLPIGVQAQAPVQATPVASASAPVLATAKPTTVNDPVVACERAARQLLASKGAPAADVNFLAAPTVLPGSAGDKQLVLRGGGSYRSTEGVRTFSYNCNVDSATSESVGMVMRDTTPVATKGKTATVAREPDLTHLSPAVCESAVAAALKKQSLRVSDISFDSATRTVKQTGQNTAELRGRGRALPAPGMPYNHFGFECEFDTRDGRLLGSRLAG
ncbi:MAG: hypothetical protein RIS44_1234 [Pseudomonadota bacterium]|jgi:hypothetical protein